MYYRWFKCENEKTNFDKGKTTEQKVKDKFKDFIEHYEGQDIRTILSGSIISLQVYDKRTGAWWGRMQILKTNSKQRNNIMKFLNTKKIPLFKRDEPNFGDLINYKLQEEDLQ